MLDGHVGVEVGVGAVGVGVAEPQRDDGDVDPSGEQVHRCGVSQCVHRDVLAGQAWADGGCGRDVGGKAMLEGIAGQGLSTGVRFPPDRGGISYKE